MGHNEAEGINLMFFVYKNERYIYIEVHNPESPYFKDLHFVDSHNFCFLAADSFIIMTQFHPGAKATCPQLAPNTSIMLCKDLT